MKNAISTTENRNTNDFYPSPRWFTTDLLKHIEICKFDIIGEPCCGDGAIARPLQDHGLKVWTNDIDPNQPADHHMDATNRDIWPKLPDSDWIITNPPYGKAAAQIIQKAYPWASKGVVAFVRLTFLEGCGDRVEFFQAHPPTNILVFPRYAFRRGATGRWATDSTPVVAAVWDKRDRSGETKMVWLTADQIEGFYRNPDEGRLLMGQRV
jgi:hypothetical protein